MRDLCLHPRDREPRLPRNGEVQYPVLCAKESGHAGQHQYATFPAKPVIQGELVPAALEAGGAGGRSMRDGVIISSNGFVQFGNGPLIPATDIKVKVKPGSMRRANDKREGGRVDIVEFLTARLDEDERGAREASDQSSGEWFMGDKWNVYGVEDKTPWDDHETNELIVYGNMKVQSEHIARHDPARVLAEVEAKRRLLAQAAEMRDLASDTEAWFLNDYADGIEQNLAASYDQHPDYKPEWAV